MLVGVVRHRGGCLAAGWRRRKRRLQKAGGWGKFSAYEEHGVEEYWTLDPVTLDHRFHFRNGEYLEAAEPVDGWVASRVIPGFRVRVEWLNPEALPAPADCLSELAG